MTNISPHHIVTRLHCAHLSVSIPLHYGLRPLHLSVMCHPTVITISKYNYINDTSRALIIKLFSNP